MSISIFKKALIGRPLHYYAYSADGAAAPLPGVGLRRAVRDAYAKLRDDDDAGLLFLRRGAARRRRGC